MIIGNNSEALSVANQIADATGGTAFRANDADDVVDALLAAVTEATTDSDATVLQRSVPGLLGIPADPNRPAEIWFEATMTTDLGVVPIGSQGGQTIELLNSSGELLSDMTSGNEQHTLASGEIYALRFSQSDQVGIYYLTSSGGAGSITEAEKPGLEADSSMIEFERLAQTDVNADRSTTALDALSVINRLRSVPLESESVQTETGRHDVNRDGVVSILDALLIINALHENDGVSQSARAESEQAFVGQTNFVDRTVRQFDESWILDDTIESLGLF